MNWILFMFLWTVLISEIIFTFHGFISYFIRTTTDQSTTFLFFYFLLLWYLFLMYWLLEILFSVWSMLKCLLVDELNNWNYTRRIFRAGARWSADDVMLFEMIVRRHLCESKFPELQFHIKFQWNFLQENVYRKLKRHSGLNRLFSDSGEFPLPADWMIQTSVWGWIQISTLWTCRLSSRLLQTHVTWRLHRHHVKSARAGVCSILKGANGQAWILFHSCWRTSLSDSSQRLKGIVGNVGVLNHHEFER